MSASVVVEKHHSCSDDAPDTDRVSVWDCIVLGGSAQRLIGKQAIQDEVSHVGTADSQSHRNTEDLPTTSLGSMAAIRFMPLAGLGAGAA